MRTPESVKPYSSSGAKGKQVGEMFDSIAPAYDFMNTAMTLGLHRYWRDKALRMAGKGLATQPEKALDVACGTGDVTFRLHEIYPETEITGLDLSAGMLRIAEEKLSKMAPAARSHIAFREGDSLHLPFADDTFDLVTVAYGVRNFEQLEAGYREMRRVLKPGGKICVVELSEPTNKMIKWFYRLYSRHIIPVAGKIVSHDTRAYSYLPESIAACPQREEMTELMNRAGFRDPSHRSLTLGVVTIYQATK